MSSENTNLSEENPQIIQQVEAPCFTNNVSFETRDVQNLLEKNFFFVGAHYANSDGHYDGQFPKFYARGVWENGYGRGVGHGKKVESYNGYIDSARIGDVIIVKQRIKDQKKQKAYAAGVIVGFASNPNLDNSGKLKRTTLLVAWVFPDLDLQFPFHTFGTISKRQFFKDDHDKEVKALIEKVVVRFLKYNMSVEPRHYNF